MSSHHISDVQLSNGRDIEYESMIRKAKHSRALPIYSPINLWLEDLEGFMAEIRAEGVSLGAARRRLEPRLLGTVPANKWLKAKEKAPFSVELEKITEREGRDKREKQRERRKRSEKARYRTPADQMTLTGKGNRISLVSTSGSHPGMPCMNAFASCIRSLLFLMLHKAITYTPKRQD